MPSKEDAGWAEVSMLPSFLARGLLGIKWHPAPNGRSRPLKGYPTRCSHALLPWPRPLYVLAEAKRSYREWPPMGIEPGTHEKSPSAFLDMANLPLHPPISLSVVRNGTIVHPPHSLSGAYKLPCAVGVKPLNRELACELLHRPNGFLRVFIRRGVAVGPRRTEVVNYHGGFGTFIPDATFSSK